MSDNIILIDWLAFSTQILQPNELIENLGLSAVEWMDRSGHYGYKSAKYFGGMWVLYDGREGMGVCFEMSGQGCRQYETSGNQTLEQLSVYLANNSDLYNITRLDVAFDDVDKEGNGLLDVQKIDRLARKDRYISKFQSKSGEWSGKHQDGGKPLPLAYSVYFGSAKSSVRFRIYDKAMERGGLDYHWVRFEIQMRDEAALKFIQTPGTVGQKFSGVINNYLRFIVPKKGDSNRRRWDSPDWWIKFVDSSEKISLYTKKEIDYNLSRLERYIYEQAGNSIKTFIDCVGVSYFWQRIHEREEFLNENQKNLISLYKQEREVKLDEFRKEHPLLRQRNYPKKIS